MAKELIGTIKTEGMEGRTELWAEEKGDHWQIVAVNPNGDRHETDFNAKTSIEALLVVCNQWGTEQWDLQLADEM